MSAGVFGFIEGAVGELEQGREVGGVLGGAGCPDRRAAQVPAGHPRRHAATLFSVFCPDVRAGQLRPFGPFLVPRIIAQLKAEGLSERALGELDSDHVAIAKTTGGRSVLGCMNDLALTCRLAVEDAGGLGCLNLDRLHHVLQRHIYTTRDYVPAIDLRTGSTPSTP
ncbi:MAG: DUF6933 domain-containing protein [Trebonia sp.]